MIIVGTFIPEIEIWNLDSENCEPLAVLGSYNPDEAAQKLPVKKFKQKPSKPVISESTHTDAIMCLSLNPHQNEYLASGSADCTVRVWDIDELACKATFQNLHSDKVQVVEWNRVNESLMLSGGYDGKLNVLDVRTQESAVSY